MFKKAFIVVTTIIICGVVAAACSSKDKPVNTSAVNQPSESNTNSNTNQPNDTASKQEENNQTNAHYPLTLSVYTDEGKQIEQTIEKEPQRILVIGQGFAELMLAFGEEERIAGVAYLDKSYSKYEEQVRQLPVLTDMWPSKEAVLELKPDLIISMSSAFQKERLGEITFWNERGIPVVAGINYTIGRTIESFFEDIENLGKALNIEEKTNAFLEEQKARIAAVQERATQAENKPKVLLVASGGRETYDYYSPSLCVIDEMIEGAGGEYLQLSEDTYVEMSAESILSVNPEKIIITEFQKPDSEAAKNKLMQNPMLRNVAAVQTGDVITADYTNAIRGSLDLADLYEEVARFVHPELFKGDEE